MEKYRSIFQVSPVVICLMSPEGIITDLNSRIYDFLQYKPEEVIGKHFTELPFITQNGRKKLVENLAKRLTGEEIPPYEVEFISKSGEPHIGHLEIALIKEDQGKSVEVLAIFSDVTALKRTEEKLRQINKELDETNLELQRAYNWMRKKRDQLRTQLSEEGFVFLIGRDGRIEGISEKVADTLGMQRSHLIGTLFTDLLEAEALDPFRKELELAWRGVANGITIELKVREATKFYDLKMMRFDTDDRRLALAVLRSV